MDSGIVTQSALDDELGIKRLVKIWRVHAALWSYEEFTARLVVIGTTAISGYSPRSAPPSS